MDAPMMNYLKVEEPYNSGTSRSTSDDDIGSDEEEQYLRSHRRRSLTMESHSRPAAALQSVAKCYEQRRRGSIKSSETESPETGRGTTHSSQAGCLSYYRKTKRTCFAEYGFVNRALEQMIVRKHGEDVWEHIKQLSETKVASPFLVRMLYDDKMTYSIVEAATEILGQSQNEIWEMFGETFFEFCEESGYDKILRILGGTLKDFLENLDALHDHLSTIYPGMRPPTFRCSQREDGALILHYYSERQGLEYMVIGIVKSVARKLENKEVNVEIITTQGEFLPDHVQFLVTTKNFDEASGDAALQSDEDDFSYFDNEPRISPASFCKAFPFHLMMNRDMKVVQAGHSITRIIKELEDMKYTFTDIFQVVRPNIELSFENIVSHTDTVFIIRVKDRIHLSSSVLNTQNTSYNMFSRRLSIPTEKEDTELLQKQRMRLKGQMLWLPESDRVLFLCSPSVSNLEDLVDRGIFLSDIPIHDATRDLVLLSEQFRAEYELTQKLESMTDKLQQTYRELEVEKQLTDKLVYSILPHSVADKLREGEPVEAVKYNSVTILFSGICDFNTFCSNNTPMKVVNLLNELYTKFDALAEPRIYNVYKVETVGDKYMLASGLPEKSAVHAKSIALVALDMLDIAREISINGEASVKITIGIHSGEVVASVVGQKLPHYAVFGNTVCLASRMESTGVSNCINISEATYNCLNTPECYDSQFSFKERGEIAIKGRKAPMKCYFLSRNLKKLPKIQMLLENGLMVTSPCPSPACSPQDVDTSMHASAGLLFDEMPTQHPKPLNIPKPETTATRKNSFVLPDPTTETLLRVAANLKDVATDKVGQQNVAGIT